MKLMVECPVCLRDVILDENVHEGDIFQCPHCKIWFKVVLLKGAEVDIERIE